jgi:TRAP-type C4-dicarboxylate transport system substrate-binding protein
MEQKERRGLWRWGLVIFSVAILLTPSMAPAEKIKLKAASIYPSPDVPMSMGQAMHVWQQEVTRRTNGDITFETLWGATLGPGPEHIELLRKGVVSLAQTFAWYTPGKFPLGSYTYVFPFGPTDPLAYRQGEPGNEKAVSPASGR